MHTAAFRDGGVDTIDLWESREAFEAYASGRFAEVAKQLGIQVDTPVIVDLAEVAAGPNISAYVIHP